MGRTPVKISILTLLGCASAPEATESFGVPGPDTRAADIAAVSRSTNIEARYLGSLELPSGTAESYRIGASDGEFIYLPVADSPLLSIATARRFVRPSGERMNGIERRVATELWRLGLEDPRRQALHDLGALVHQERDAAGLYEWVSLPWVSPVDDARMIFEILGRQTTPDPEAILERALLGLAETNAGLEGARARVSDLLDGTGGDDPHLAASAMLAGREALSRVNRTADVDALLLMGPIGRRAALETATRWLKQARRAPIVAKASEEDDTPQQSEEPEAPRFLVSFPVPDGAGRSDHAELATRWLATELTRSGPAPSHPKGAPRLTVSELRLEGAESRPRLDVLIELEPSTTASIALSTLARRLDLVKRAKIERGVRHDLAEAAERRRHERIEGPYPLVFTLLDAAVSGELEHLSRPIAAPRPGALTTWLDAVLKMKAAACVPLPQPDRRSRP